MNRPETYIADELRQALKDRQGGLTLQQYAAEIGLSFQMLSQILNGSRSPGNQKVLDYLAPKGYAYVHRDQWLLMPKQGQ
jgi:transcriptional regulator with XRE-family HTH domain